MLWPVITLILLFFFALFLIITITDTQRWCENLLKELKSKRTYPSTVADLPYILAWQRIYLFRVIINQVIALVGFSAIVSIFVRIGIKDVLSSKLPIQDAIMESVGPESTVFLFIALGAYTIVYWKLKTIIHHISHLR